MTHASMTQRLLTADTVATDTEVWSPGWIRIAGGRIHSCGPGEPPVAAGIPREHVAATVVPGFVDIHAHGAGGVDFADAADHSVSPALEWHLAHGTTSQVASLATATLPDLRRQVSALAEHVADGALVGVHLEGPWLSPGHRGAHAEALLRHPDPAEVSELVIAGVVRMVTLAPELPGADAAIAAILDAGAVVAVGHTSSDASTARRAFDLGATVATHLFNGMPPLHHRSPGPVGAALDDDRVTLELILDGEHLAPEAVALVLRAAGRRAAAVSDAISATGVGDGHLVLAGSPVTVTGGVARTDSGSLAGSTRALDSAFAALVRDHGRSLPEAVAATSTIAARAVGLADAGTVAPGSRADLVALDHLSVAAVMRGGEWVVPPAR